MILTKNALYTFLTIFIASVIIILDYYYTKVYGNNFQWLITWIAVWIIAQINLKTFPKYYYKVNKNQVCTERCMIKFAQGGKDVRIGSNACKSCKNCLAFNDNQQYIVCKRIKDATDDQLFNT